MSVVEATQSMAFCYSSQSRPFFHVIYLQKNQDHFFSTRISSILELADCTFLWRVNVWYNVRMWVS